MQFDVFHSIGRIDSLSPRLTDIGVFEQFFAQAVAAEELGYDTMWVAESHFSSEVQKHNSEPVIPHYHGEVGLNADSSQLAHALFARTKRLNFGTAIFNIVGGNGGPIAAADRLRSLAFLNSLSARPRRLYFGIAQGRFPYINAPFGIFPRTDLEKILWPATKRLIFLEALEIFLRLSLGETLGASDLTRLSYKRTDARDDAEWKNAMMHTAADGSLSYTPRWSFEPLQLVPALNEEQSSYHSFVLGSHDPDAQRLAFRYCDVDAFNLSFTPPQEIERLHAKLQTLSVAKPWHRRRLPRTVLVFIDEDPVLAQKRAAQAFDTYIEAMRGTVALPPKEELLARALIGHPDQIIAALQPGPMGFHQDDRLMLWFEFNQQDHRSILKQMTLFAQAVAPHFRSVPLCH